MIRDALFAAGVVLAASTDWQLVLPQEADCAVDQTSCEAARAAIRHGWIASIPRHTPTICEPRPFCRNPESEVIRGYNDRSK